MYDTQPPYKTYTLTCHLEEVNAHIFLKALKAKNYFLIFYEIMAYFEYTRHILSIFS
jgi:hypothetical protein